MTVSFSIVVDAERKIHNFEQTSLKWSDAVLKWCLFFALSELSTSVLLLCLPFFHNRKVNVQKHDTGLGIITK